MSKVTVALLSFTVGACATFLLIGGNQTSIVAHAFAQTRGIVFEGATPTVPPLRGNVVSSSTFVGLVQPLDGLDCRDCTFKDVTFEYGGGAYRLENARLAGAFRLKLTGAAANTATLLKTFGLLGCANPPSAPAVPPNSPVIQTAVIKTAITGTVTVPYKGK